MRSLYIALFVVGVATVLNTLTLLRVESESVERDEAISQHIVESHKEIARHEH